MNAAKLFKTALCARGFNVRTALTASRRPKPRKFPPKVCLCDIDLARVDGYEVVRRIRRQVSHADGGTSFGLQIQGPVGHSPNRLRLHWRKFVFGISRMPTELHPFGSRLAEEVGFEPTVSFLPITDEYFVDLSTIFWMLKAVNALAWIPFLIPLPMSFLTKKPGSPFYYACFDVTLPDGTSRRLKKSTKKTKFSDAAVELQRLEELEQRRVNEGGNLKSDKAYALLAEATEAAAKGELSEARARAFIALLSEFSTGARLRFYSVRQWAEEWLRMKQATSKLTTMRRYSGSITMFLAWLGEKADARLEAITKADARAFRDAIRTGWNPDENEPKRKFFTGRRTAKTTNHFTKDIAALFRAAVRDSLLAASPFTGLERLPEDDSMEREVFNFEEISRLLETAGKPAWQNEVFSSKMAKDEEWKSRCRDWQGMILLGTYVGSRLGDCARFRKSYINLRDGFLSFMPAKTERKKKKLVVPIHPRLASWLEAHLNSMSDSEFLFPSLQRTRVSGKTGLSSQFIAIMAAAGVDRGKTRSAQEGRTAQHSRGFHSLRHTLTSALANSNVSEEIRRQIVGHDSAEVHQIYTHHERKTLADALEKLPSV